MVYYGFCIKNNKHDSVLVRVRRVIDNRRNLNLTSLIEALVLDEMDVKAEIISGDEMKLSCLSMKVRLKATKLHTVLMSYLRAHLLLSYPDITDI